MLIHYDLATFINHPDGCNTDTHLVPSLSVFDPSKLNVTQWVDTIQSVGANYATLVIKHNCGFALYPSKQSFTNRDGIVEPYNYTIAYTDNDSTRDVAGEFASGMSSRGLGHGYYFSVNFNNYLNVANNQVYNDTTAGQQPINQTEYNRLTYAMLTEVWSNYGDLTEIWLDGGFRSDQQDAIAKLIKQYQPKANVFNGCSQEDGYCVSRNSGMPMISTAKAATYTNFDSQSDGSAPKPVSLPPTTGLRKSMISPGSSPSRLTRFLAATLMAAVTQLVPTTRPPWPTPLFKTATTGSGPAT